MTSPADREWGLVIDGAASPSVSGATFPDISPHDESVSCQVPDGNADDVDRAVAAAAHAFASWSKTDVRHRGRLLRDGAALLREHADELAMLDAIDVGNTYTLMRTDVEF